ncbi:IclR family transcriptional regulator domain-containing protein [Paracandidimonas soli]|uniref:IclR family transcriptional regulator domain-containing protein n=1 Tax=Paracandidimonas soli TaxID=1917182 RepID=UPI003341F710
MPLPTQLALIPDKLNAFTDRTIINRDQLLRELGNIRQNGYCVSLGEVGERPADVGTGIAPHPWRRRLAARTERQAVT